MRARESESERERASEREREKYIKQVYVRGREGRAFRGHVEHAVVRERERESERERASERERERESARARAREEGEEREAERGRGAPCAGMTRVRSLPDSHLGIRLISSSLDQIR